MQIDIDIDPCDLSEAELLDCVKYAAQKGIGPVKTLEHYLCTIDCSEERFEELLRELYEYFAKQTTPAPPPVRDFFWHVYGKLV